MKEMYVPFIFSLAPVWSLKKSMYIYIYNNVAQMRQFRIK